MTAEAPDLTTAAQFLKELENLFNLRQQALEVMADRLDIQSARIELHAQLMGTHADCLERIVTALRGVIDIQNRYEHGQTVELTRQALALAERSLRDYKTLAEIVGTAGTTAKKTEESE